MFSFKLILNLRLVIALKKLVFCNMSTFYMLCFILFFNMNRLYIVGHILHFIFAKFNKEVH